MDPSGRKLTALWLSCVLVAASVVGGFGLTGAMAVSGNVAANAAGNASVSALQTAGNEVANPTVRSSFPDVGPGNDTVRVNFSGTGADFKVGDTAPIVSDVTVDGTQYQVSTVSLAESDEAVDIDLKQDVKTGSDVQVNVSLRGVRNPPTAGNYDVTLDLRNGSGTTVRANGTLAIVQGGDVTGTITDADTNTALTDSSVDVEFVNKSTGNLVTSYGVDPTTGDYAGTVPPGTYYLNASADNYSTRVKTVTVTNGGSVTQDISLESGTWINGTITDGSGAAVSGVKVIAIPGGLSGRVAASEKTAADGTYSLAVNASRSYGVLVGTGSTYEIDYNQSVSVTADQTTVVNLTAREKPASGTLQVTVTGPDGNAITNAPMFFRSADYKYGGRTTTNSSGVAEFTRPAGTYTLRIQPSSYGSKVVESVQLNESETKSISVSLAEAATVSGTVTDTDGSAAAQTQVLVSDGANFYPTVTDNNGDYSVTVSPGNYSVSVFADGKTATTKQVSVSGGGAATADFSLKTAQVVDTNATITSGPGDDSNLEAYTTLQSGLLRVKLVDSASWKGPETGGGKPDDLSSLGATRSTEFRIKITVQNFESDSLIWGIRNGSWQTQQNGSYTDIIVTGQTADIQVIFNKQNLGVGPLLFQSPQQINWPSGKNAAATNGVNNAVTFGLFNLSTLPGEVSNNLDGLSTTTNAQRFKPATVDNGTLEVWMAAPSKTVSGQDHTGFYQANIPQSQLDEWGVDDPESELQVTYKDSSRNFTVTDTAKGARVSLRNISYSASPLEIEPNETAVNAGGGGGGGGGGTDTVTTTPTNNGTTTTPTSNDTTTTPTTVTPTTQNNSVVATVDTVTANETVSVPVSTTTDDELNETVPVSQVNLTTDDTVSNLTVTVEPTSVSSVDVPPVSEATDASAAEYVEIEATAPDEDIDSAAVTVTLNESERRAIGATPENVTVYRYEDGWSALDTTHLGNGTYRATAPGFSVFAVGSEEDDQQQSQRTPTPTPTATPTSTPTATQTATAAPTETGGTTATDTPTVTDAGTEPATATATTTSGGIGPGFGPLLALLAAALSVLLARWTRR